MDNIIVKAMNSTKINNSELVTSSGVFKHNTLKSRQTDHTLAYEKNKYELESTFVIDRGSVISSEGNIDNFLVYSMFKTIIFTRGK